MSNRITGPFAELFATSPEIERQAFILRPRTMAATWGGLLACKAGAMVVISPEAGAAMFAVTLVTGIVATYARFGWRGEGANMPEAHAITA